MTRKKTNLLLRDTLLCSVASVITCGILYFLFIHVHIFDPFEKAFEDFSFTDIYTSQNFKERKTTDKIILINVGNYDRAAIAQGINAVASNKPKVIGLDIIFKDKKDAEKDSILHQALQKNSNLVSAYILDEKGSIESDPYFITKNKGFINFDKSDAVVREFTGLKRTENQVHTSFATRIAESAGLLDANIKNKLDGPLKINYYGDQNSFLTFDLKDVISGEKIPAIKDAIVLFGYLGVPTGNPNDIVDKHFTPLNPKFAGKSIPDMYGLVLHANTIKMLIDADLIYKVPKPLVFCLAFIFCLIIVMGALILHKKSGFMYHLMLKIMELVIAIVLLYFTLLLLDQNIHIQIEPIIILSFLGLEMVIFYELLLHNLQKRWKWESYLSE